MTTREESEKAMEKPAEVGKADKPLTHVEIINKILARHHTWWWAVLLYQKAWYLFTPWPLPFILYPIPKCREALKSKGPPKPGEERKSRPAWTTSSGWMTLTIALWWALVFVSPKNVERDLKIATEGAKVLFSGAFLLGTILSVSVALPGATVVKRVMGKKPEAALEFVIPFMWAFMWGLTGAIALMFMPNLMNVWAPLHHVVVFLGLYGAFMELNALGHTIRTYTIGLVLVGHEELQKAAAEARKKAEEEARKRAKEEEAEAEVDDAAARSLAPEDAADEEAPASLAPVGRLRAARVAPDDDGEAEQEAEAEAAAARLRTN